jgi:diguanylate cyclase (GGDEF)-like protein/PAS domain S-box-containing protein
MTHLTPAQPIPDWLQALHSSDSAWIITDDDLNVIHINEGLTRLLGYRLEDLQGKRPLETLIQAWPDLAAHIREQLMLSGAYHGELQVQRLDGSQVWMAATVNTLNRHPFPTEGATAEVLVFTDIGFTKRFEALQRQMLEDVVMEKPLPELLQDMCVALEAIAPRVRVSVMAVDADGIMHPLAAPSMPAHIVDLMRGVRMGAEVGACGVAAFTGNEVIAHDIAQDPNWCGAAPLFVQAGLLACWSSPIKNPVGQVVGTLALYFDSERTPNKLHRQLVLACLHLCAIAMERDANKHRIRQLAYYDTLTHLPNRTMFNECAEQALHSMRGHTGLLFFLDLDRFKLWNDSLGHSAGDALLREIALRLGNCMRPEDVVGRLSSDEFAVLMPGYSTAQIPELAQRMLDAIAEPFSINGVMTIPNACIGVCSYPEDGTDIETLLRRADQAMYAAKSQGCQLWEIYQPEMGQVSQERAKMERELRKALAEGVLQLHFQPQVFSHASHAPAQLYGVEALSRWHHPEWGWVAPPRFIAVAEDAGLIHQLTTWLINAACAQLAAWRTQGLRIPHIAVNLSTNNFHDPAFAQHVQATLHQHGLSCQDLMLEITESVMLDSSPATLDNLKALNEMGIRLSMDDFGTGYSSLSYLHRLPISELKLDKSFVQDVCTSAAASALTRSVLNIAQSLGMTVVAEGVETLAQAQWLSEQGCPILQGYHFAKPMPGREIAQWMQKQAITQPA